ncbi:MAG TPA: hypothetical protein VEZ20_14105 [Allosphingosinicella sp.]|jgi:hypothetical protein|nr:hypothetical protein [Allosphingosinicella sp.]
MRIISPILPFAAAAAMIGAPALAQEPPPADPSEPQTQPARRGSDSAAEFVTGVEYQEGDYFTGERVEIVTVQNATRLRTGSTILSASLPWHRIEAPGNVVGGGGPLGLPILVDPGRPAGRDVREGVGDLRLGLGHTLPSVGGVELTVSGQVKLPTASARRGIGTGETDVAVGAEVARRFGPVTPYAAVGYTFPGDPETFALQNSLSARGGVALQLGRGLRGNVSYNYAESLRPLAADEQQISTGLNAALSRRLNLGVYGNAGLSEGAPDIGAGVSLGFRIF